MTFRPRKRRHVTRRDAMKFAGGCAALTNTSLLSTIFSMSATNTVLAQTADLTGYKAMVCLFLFGGNDSFNMLTPTTGTERADYVTARSGLHTNGAGGLALPDGDLHTITDSQTSRTFGVHPMMPEVKTLYDANKLSFVCNVGSLIQPTTMAQYQAQSNLPLGLFSHADLQRHWMTSVPQSRSEVTGWAGRMADLVAGPTNSNANISMNISLNSVNMLQTGGSTVPYVIGNNGASEVDHYNQPWTRRIIFKNLSEDAFTRSYSNLLEKTFAEVNQNSIAAAAEFNAAVSDETAIDTYFPASGASNLQNQLKMVAKSIAAQSDIGQNRQSFFVSHHGWDNHDELINNQAYNLMEVSQALKSFQDAMDGIGMADNVVLFTASDFARTLSSNGQGSDHAWGGNQIVMGGPVVGGQLHGTYPTSLAPGNSLDLGRGRLLPTTSVDEMAAELAMWYGVANDSTLEDILPNIRNFSSANNGLPIGFLA